MTRAPIGSLFVAFAVLLSVWLVPSPAGAQTAQNVLVVVNAANADSVRIGEYYAKKRQVPSEQLLRLADLPADPPDGLDRPVFDRAIHLVGWQVHQAGRQVRHEGLELEAVLECCGHRAGRHWLCRQS